jgi:hypothetical protein
VPLERPADAAMPRRDERDSCSNGCPSRQSGGGEVLAEVDMDEVDVSVAKDLRNGGGAVELPEATDRDADADDGGALAE